MTNAQAPASVDDALDSGSLIDDSACQDVDDPGNGSPAKHRETPNTPYLRFLQETGAADIWQLAEVDAANRDVTERASPLADAARSSSTVRVASILGAAGATLWTLPEEVPSLPASASPRSTEDWRMRSERCRLGWSCGTAGTTA